MSAKAVMSEIGMVTIGISDALIECRKIMMMITTRAIASRMVMNTLRIDRSMNIVES